MDTNNTNQPGNAASAPRTDESKALQFFPSMSGNADIEARERVEAREVEVHRNYQREVENIREHGPLSRLTERVLTEEEAGKPEDKERSQKEQPFPEEQEIRALAESGDYDTLTARIKTDLTEIGAGEQDIAMVDYFKNIVLNSNDPAWKRWAADMCLWARKEVKAARERRK